MTWTNLRVDSRSRWRRARGRLLLGLMSLPAVAAVQGGAVPDAVRAFSARHGQYYARGVSYLRLDNMLSPSASSASADTSGLPLPRDGSHDFDFEAGSWKVRNSSLVHPLTDSATWIHFNGTSVARTAWNGRAVFLELESDPPSGHSEGLIVRLYNPQARQWSVAFASAADGNLGEPEFGAFSGGRGVFYGHERVNGRMVLSRSVLSDITHNSYRLEESVSIDGGKTWVTTWISDHTRVGS